jgi:hypothetical protein
MRRAVHHGTVTRLATPSATSAATSRGSCDPPRQLVDCSSSTEDSLPVEVLLSAAGTFAKVGDMAPTDATSDRNRHLAIAIMQRIESRLPGRVKNLVVRIAAGTVVLEGQCATYYTKQLAQHAALGILEDEHLENAIVVTIGR